MSKQNTSIEQPRMMKFFSPLIECDLSAGSLEEEGSFASVLAEAQRIAEGGNGAGPQAAIAWLTQGEPAYSTNRLRVSELTQNSHGLMLHALLNALPIADISSDEPNVMNDTSSRPDFENVCPVRFLALFPIASQWIQTVGYLVLYDVKPRVLRPGAYCALTKLAQQIATANG